ncbi:hypothetical protein D3C80_2045330 [compost metagenome]
MLLGGDHDWLVRFYREDETALAFWRSVLDELPRPVHSVEPDDDPHLLSFLVTRSVH